MNENDKALIDIMIDTQKQYTKSNMVKDKNGGRYLFET